MKSLTFTLFFLLSLISGNITAGDYVKAQLFYSKFYSPVDGPYLETYLSVVGSSVVFIKNDNGKFQGSIEVTMIFSKDGEVKSFDKYELSSPEVEDTTNIDFNFLDQQRFNLSNGIYDFEIQIEDMNSDMSPFKTTQTIEIDFPEDEISVSGIELIESYSKTTQENILSKSGLDLVPYVYNFYPDAINHLQFYVEVYNTIKVLGEGEKFLLNYYIENYENKQHLQKFSRFKRETAQQVNVLFADFDITYLPSGNYYLIVEVRDKENHLKASNKMFIQRSNPDVEPQYADISDISVENSFVSKITNMDTLMEYIHCLVPISSNIEMQFIKYQIDKPGAELDLMQRFFLSFWLNRNNLDPESAWNDYLIAVEFVDDQFGYPGKKGKKGYETDRGHIYLKYGPPNTITDRPFDASASGMTINNGGVQAPDPGSVPYQIWFYYSLNNMANRKFVFANPNLATYDYELIHSNVPGEIQNANWQQELSRIKQGLTMPGTDTYNGQSGEYYNYPR